MEGCFGDYKSIDFKRKYDYILLDGVLEHFLDVGLELDMLHSLLKEDGKLFVAIPDSYIARSLYNYADFRKELMLCHKYIFSKDTLVGIAKLHGFDFLKGEHRILPHYLFALFQKGAASSNLLNEHAYRRQKIKLFEAEILYHLYCFVRLEKIKKFAGRCLRFIKSAGLTH